MSGDISFEDLPTGRKGLSDAGDFQLLALWERLRLAYNLILIAEVVCLIFALRLENWSRPGFPRFLVSRAIAANICFCAGPVFDGYFHRLGIRGGWGTAILFGLGTIFSMVVAFASIFAFGTKGFD